MRTILRRRDKGKGDYNTRGLIVRYPWIDMILAGLKPWEIRGRNTGIRETIALIQSGSGKIMGVVQLVACIKLTPYEFEHNRDKHRISEGSFNVSYREIYAWVLKNPVRFDQPIPYQHPPGAVVWVNLDELESVINNHSVRFAHKNP